MIEFICASCKNAINDFGGILLSPAGDDSKVLKFHLCKDCYKILENTMIRILLDKHDD